MKMQAKITRTAVLAALLAMSGAGMAADDTSQKQSQQGAQNAAQQAQQGTSRLQGDERQFLMKAAQGGMLEVEASKLAMERATSPQVKEFARMLHDDHTAATKKLMELAQQKGVQLPSELDAKHKQELASLQKLKGEEFDRAYLQRMGLKDHKKDIQDFEKQAKNAKDEQVRSFAEQTLPALRKHLSHAQQISGGASAQSGQPAGGSSASGGADSPNRQQ